MFGRPEAAAAAKLFVVAAGDPATLQAVSPVLDAIGQRTFVVAEQPEAASLVKLSGNFLIASVIESLGEAMALVGKAGVDKQQYLEILTSTLFGGARLPDVRRADRRRRVRAGRIRRHAWAQGRPAGARRR